jgi:hypothetical protein
MKGYVEHEARMDRYRSLCDEHGGSSKISDAIYDKDGFIVGAFVREYIGSTFMDVGEFYYEGKSAADRSDRGFTS